ncbi:FAD-binding protein [Nocardia elegans]|jgi:FAD/FMN-containing dehydrogenase|nr:FAD-binding protein [Nocardia elegans]MBF6451378.1 FAD-binding protein [Nocardia elegans]
MPAAFPAALLGSGRPLTLRGSGHSCDGQTVSEAELLVTYEPDTAARQLRDLGDGLFEVPAGMSWYGLERHLNGRGRAIPVLPNYLHMSVGGTLSVGGVGVDSVRHGMQIDHVERIQLIDGMGISRWCSRTDNPELFRFALGGLGTVGLIERVVLRTVGYRSRTHLHRVEHASLAELADHAERVAQRDDVDVYWAEMRRGRISATVGWHSERTDCASGNCEITSDLTFAGHPVSAKTPPADRVRLWADYVVPAGQFSSMLAAVEGIGHRSLLDDPLTMVYVLIIRRPIDAPAFAFGPVGAAPVSIGVGLYASVERTPAAIDATRSALRECFQHCCESGGRPYLYGVTELDAATAERLYGDDVDRLGHLRSSHRLHHVNSHVPLARVAAERHDAVANSRSAERR